MRELKFRAWSEETKSFECFDLYEGTECGLTNLQIWARNTEIEQYTGLKDKNGKEIYEGDIVNIQGIKYYVDFEFGGFWFNNDNRKWKANRPFTHFQEINDAEVIGNIHENPELLEDKE